MGQIIYKQVKIFKLFTTQLEEYLHFIRKKIFVEPTAVVFVLVQH